jgi:protein-tyrosine-phosphatase
VAEDQPRQGATVADTPEVLFVCVHNAGRSQMAAALLDHHANGKVVVRSAGSDPADRLNPAVVAAMAEVDVDLSQAFPKPLTDASVRAADVVITMGCGDACPIYPGKRYEDWQLQDPAGQPVEVVRGIRDQIDAASSSSSASYHRPATSVLSGWSARYLLRERQ